MAEEQKAQQEVEIDTDGVNEEIINVDKPVEPDEAYAKKEDVDLGYTDPIRETKVEEEPQEKKEEPKTEVEIKEEKEDKEEKKVDSKPENLKEKQSSYQKRINELVFQAKEAERREKAALNYAKGLKKKYQTVETKLNETDNNYLKEIQARVTSEQDALKKSLKEAMEAQDAEKVAEINSKMTSLAVENEKVNLTLQEREAQKKQNEENKDSSKDDSIPGEQPVKISQKAQDWASKNEWFGTDRVLTSAAMAIHEDLVGQGIETESDEYYNNINKRMKEYFPQKFAQDSTEKEPATKQPVQNVAGVSRRQGGRKSVKLTKSQVVIAKKLGVPLEEYAKFVKGGN
jgi:chromosome segregation ATPase